MNQIKARIRLMVLLSLLLLLPKNSLLAVMITLQEHLHQQMPKTLVDSNNPRKEQVVRDNRSSYLKLLGSPDTYSYLDKMPLFHEILSICEVNLGYWVSIFSSFIKFICI